MASISNPSSAETKRARSAGESIREQRLLGDPLVRVLSPSHVECKLCNREIKLSDKSAFDTFHWDNHRGRCVAKANGSQRRRKGKGDANLGTHSGAQPGPARYSGGPQRHDSTQYYSQSLPSSSSLFTPALNPFDSLAAVAAALPTAPLPAFAQAPSRFNNSSYAANHNPTLSNTCSTGGDNATSVLQRSPTDGIDPEQERQVAIFLAQMRSDKSRRV